MKRVLLAAMVALTFTSVATAAVVQVGDRLTYEGQTDGKSYGNGGEFSWKHTINTGLPGAFQEGQTSDLFTFCAEVGQYIASPVYVTNLASTNSTVTRTLTDEAAWLFYRYAKGGNAAVATHASLDSTTAGTIQWAIWDEMAYPAQFANPNTALYNSWFTAGTGAYDTDVAWKTKTGTFDLYVQAAWLSTNYADVPQTANNFVVGAGGAQDQLVLFSTGSLNEVPEPASLAIWSLVTAAAAFSLRRRRQNGRTRWSEENRQAINSIVSSGR